MPAITAQCPSCGVRGSVDESLVGRRIKCRCGSEFVVSRPAPLDVSCPSCGVNGRLDSSYVGKSLTCKCGASFLVGAGGSVLSGASSAPGAARASAGGSSGAAEWQPGQVVLDTYEVKGILGQGGMGRVYRVHHRGWNTDLAAKQALPHIFARQGGAESFIAECETWVNLGLHPHTVSCYYVRPVDGVPVVFAELVEGGSLKEWIDDGRLYAGGPTEALKRVLDMAIQFAWGLQHAHEQGLVHQDVKPANVMMTLDGTAKVTDFGVARARAAVEAMGEAAGGGTVMAGYGGMTPAYCSPEQAEAAAQAKAGVPREQWPKLTRRTDIWSWAVSLFEMLAGVPPTGAGQVAGHTFEAMLDEPEEWRVPPPEGLVALLRQCFQGDPEDRPHDMPAVAQALAHVYAETAAENYPREAPRAAEALADTLSNRAVSLLDLGKREDAKRFLAEALQLDASHPEAVYNEGLLRWRDGEMTDEALVQRLRDVSGALPGNWVPLYLLAQVHLERDDCASAIEALSQLDGTDSDRREVRSTWVRARARLPRSRRLLQSVPSATGNGLAGLSADGRLAVSAGIARVPERSAETHADLDWRRLLAPTASVAIRVWDLATGTPVRDLEGHSVSANGLCISKDGRLALSAGGGRKRELKVWDLQTGRCLHALELGPSESSPLALSEDAKRALVAVDTTEVKLLDVGSGRFLKTIGAHAGGLTAVCLTPDGSAALTAGYDKAVRLWDLPSGRWLRTFEGHSEGISCIAVSDDGRYLLSAGSDRCVRLWDVQSGRCIRVMEGHRDNVLSVGFAADGVWALSGGEDGTVRLWEVSTGRCLRTFSGHCDLVISVASGADRALSASLDTTIKAWDIAGNDEAFLAPAALCRALASEAMLSAASLYRTALHRSGEALARGDAVAAARHLREARAQPGCRRKSEAIQAWKGLYARLPRAAFAGGWQGGAFEGDVGSIRSVCVSPDGEHVLSGGDDRVLHLWNAGARSCVQSLHGMTGGVRCVSISPDGRRALSAGEDRLVWLWELDTGNCLCGFRGHEGIVESVCWSPDGGLVLSGSADNTLKLWDVRSGLCVSTLRGHVSGVNAVSFSPDGRHVLSASSDKTIRLWHADTGRCLRVLEGHDDWVTSLSLSADGSIALSGSGRMHAGSGQARLWDVAAGRSLRVLDGHTDQVSSVALSADGRCAVSGSWDGTVRIWRADVGECARIFDAHSERVTCVTLSPDGSFALSGGADRKLRTWILDWELAERTPVDWDEGARSFLRNFLTLHAASAARGPAADLDVFEILPAGEMVSGQSGLESDVFEMLPAAGERTTQASGSLSDGLEGEEHPFGLISMGGESRPSVAWSDEDFARLLRTLGCAGYGWLRHEGVRRELERMAAAWSSEGAEN